jgi:hypothetical protein
MSPALEPNATPHDLQHTWATWFYAITKDPLLLKTEGSESGLQIGEKPVDRSGGPPR